MFFTSLGADVKKASRFHPTDLAGLSRLAIEGTVGMTDLVEAMHYNIASSPGIPGRSPTGATSDITGFVYNSVRAMAGLVGVGIDSIITPIMSMLEERRSTPEREAALAVLNGVMGDHLAATNNPLAISMRLRFKGRPLTLQMPALGATIANPSRKLVVLVHGLCMNDRQWTRKGHNHGTALTRDLGYTAVYLHYNSGLHISTNGRAFADLIETLLSQWPEPVEELAIVAHSLGGLVSRSAYYYGSAAGHRWPRRLGKLIFLGTPHHGAPFERGGNLVDVLLQLSPYTSPLSRLAKIRSAGITDLRYGNLLDEDWEARGRFEYSGDRRHPVPLPAELRCYAIAGTIARKIGYPGCELSGDGIVPVDSALGRHQEPARTLSFAESQQWIGNGMNHWDLLNKRAVYKQIVRWLA